jgi:hypothetical protein
MTPKYNIAKSLYHLRFSRQWLWKVLPSGITPCSLLKADWHFRGTYGLHLLAACSMLVSYLAYSSTLKMEATHSSKTSFRSQQTTHCVISQKTELFRTNLISMQWKLMYAYKFRWGKAMINYCQEQETSVTFGYTQKTAVACWIHKFRNIRIARQFIA